MQIDSKYSSERIFVGLQRPIHTCVHTYSKATNNIHTWHQWNVCTCCVCRVPDHTCTHACMHTGRHTHPHTHTDPDTHTHTHIHSSVLHQKRETQIVNIPDKTTSPLLLPSNLMCLYTQQNFKLHILTTYYTAQSIL